jgi:hypothetical protein
MNLQSSELNESPLRPVMQVVDFLDPTQVNDVKKSDSCFTCRVTGDVKRYFTCTANAFTGT